ncbi:MAG: 30S ribosomal protein S6 [Kiritimatiellae bacterium]|nr:30S ribosomal protein S6 [Kiritimatiellia bacterium]
MRRYEGMFIFPERMKDEQLDAAIETVKTEIEKAGGSVTATTRLGRRTFARTLKRETAGHYVVITFDLEPEKLQSLSERWRLSPDVFRFRVFRAEAPVSAGEEAEHGVAQ